MEISKKMSQEQIKQYFLENKNQISDIQLGDIGFDDITFIFGNGVKITAYSDMTEANIRVGNDRVSSSNNIMRHVIKKNEPLPYMMVNDENKINFNKIVSEYMPIPAKVEYYFKYYFNFAMNIIKNNLKENKQDKSGEGLYYVWQSNLTCIIMDNSDLEHDKANEIACKFLDRLIGER